MSGITGGSPNPCEQKIRFSIGLAPRTARILEKEARRLGISNSDIVRRVMDSWADGLERAQTPAAPIRVLDRETGQVRTAR